MKTKHQAINVKVFGHEQQWAQEQQSEYGNNSIFKKKKKKS